MLSHSIYTPEEDMKKHTLTPAPTFSHNLIISPLIKIILEII